MSPLSSRRRGVHGILFIAFAGVGGCLPATYTQVPQISGRVVSPSGVPSANAEVRIDRVSAHSPQRWTLRTDANGAFRQREIRTWGVAWLVPIDAMPPRFRLSATDGSRTARPLQFDGGDLYHPHYLGLGNAAPKIDVGDVRLE